MFERLKRWVFNEAYTVEHDTQWMDRIEELIKGKHVKYYEYEGFDKIEEIGSGLVGKVYKANWKRSETCVALRLLNLNNYTVKEIIHEVNSKGSSFLFNFY